MSTTPKYVLDSNVLIEAARRYYPLDFAKPFWDGLTREAKSMNIGSIDKVQNELKTGNDALKDWAVTSFDPYFYSTQSDEIMAKYAELVIWCQTEEQYQQFAKDEFMRESNADTWVIAYALANNCKIVTHEVFDKNIKKKVPIPNVCEAFNVSYCDTFQMLRELNFSF